MPDYQKELVEYRLQTAQAKLHSAKILLDAVEQYEKAEKFVDAVGKYLVRDDLFLR